MNYKKKDELKNLQTSSNESFRIFDINLIIVYRMRLKFERIYYKHDY